MAGFGDLPAICFRGRELSYVDVTNLISEWQLKLAAMNVREGSIVGVLGEFSPASCSLLFALLAIGAIVVPFTKASESDLERFATIAGVELVIQIDATEVAHVRPRPDAKPNSLVTTFRQNHHAGLVVFTSGSTGEPKGILHDCERVFKKFLEARAGWRTILFLLMDHFGGFNTFCGAFAYGGTAVCVDDRSPASVCAAIQSARASLLPTTPTFLNLLLASKVYRSYDLSSVRLITYGTEVMTEATLARVPEMFPNAEVKQTYGLSELGVLRSKSEDGSSVWVKLGGRGFETKIVDDTLWIRSEANMVGYLNAPSPFDAEGWMCTGDQVEVKGDLVRILGRKSDMINVGGQKVFPAEIETVLLAAPNVCDATVYGRPHPMMGNIVAANVTLVEPEDPEAVTERLRAYCSERLQRYKVPMRFAIVSGEAQHTDRFKKRRG
jgi:acyl-CoA synthetase (AMP-forming)/AMP-acid ligase II